MDVALTIFRYQTDDTIRGLQIPKRRRTRLFERTYPTIQTLTGYIKGSFLTFVQVRDYECKFVCKAGKTVDEKLLHSLRLIDDMWRDRFMRPGRQMWKNKKGEMCGYTGLIGKDGVVQGCFEKDNYEPDDDFMNERPGKPANKGFLDASAKETCQEYGTFINARRGYRDPVLKIQPRFEERTCRLEVFVVSCEPLNEPIDREREADKARSYVPTFDVRRMCPARCQEEGITDAQIESAKRHAMMVRNGRWM